MEIKTTTPTWADQLSPVIYSRYKKPELYVSDFSGPLVKYQLNFIDGSTLNVVMTSRQRDGIKRSKVYPYIKNIGGLGNVRPVENG